jgi:hypothetical protein
VKELFRGWDYCMGWGVHDSYGLNGSLQTNIPPSNKYSSQVLPFLCLLIGASISIVTVNLYCLLVIDGHLSFHINYYLHPQILTFDYSSYYKIRIIFLF